MELFIILLFSSIALLVVLVIANVFTLYIASVIFAEQAGFNYSKGRIEFRNEQEKQYTRKRV